MFVARDESESPVISVMAVDIVTINSVRSSPTLPSTHPKRRYITTPRIVSTLGV